MIVPKLRGTNENFAKILPKCENMAQNISFNVSSKMYFFTHNNKLFRLKFQNSGRDLHAIHFFAHPKMTAL